MRRIILFFSICCICSFSATAQFGSYPESYSIDKEDLAFARKVISNPEKSASELVMPNPAAGAQWFSDASLGLFLHWGIHSVAGAQPSWDMIANYKYGGKVAPPDKYYALAEQFSPREYNPSRWLEAAKKAGFNYVVLTTKHHDGYALWPSKYGIGTKQYMAGRDLLQTYVDACRANGMKVGFYFSPRDWHYPGFMKPHQFEARTFDSIPVITDPVANQKAYEAFLAFTLRQLKELLTDYGKIDILWFDGMGFPGANEMYTKQIYAWIRSLQPDILINDRWSRIVNPHNPNDIGLRFGDFLTPFECQLPTYVPSNLWEHCDIWTKGGGGWGYDKTGTFRSYEWFFRHLVACRSLGGNFLPNVGPSGEGEMHPNYYVNMEAIANWMRHSRESVIGCGPSPGIERSNVMITTRKKDWYLHLLPDFKGEVSVKTDKKPKSVSLLRTGEAVSYHFQNGFLSFSLPQSLRTDMDDVVKIEFR